MAIDTMGVVAPPQEAIPLPESGAPLRLNGWDHVALSVPDLVEAERWYVDVLGAEPVGRYAWGGDTAHEGAPPHVDAELEQWQVYLRSKGVKLRNNGAVHGHPGFGAVSLYFEDPWGAKLEIVTWLPDYATAVAEVTKRDGVIMGAPNAGGHRPARG
jgi:catechol 2,3-dioxygenase-like lactoylglutathione lyase family enzyme